MPANLYPYDSSGTSSANLISNEVQSVDTAVDIAVFPLHGPVYAESMIVESLQGGSWVTLEEQKDYVYSPVFLSVSASTAQDAVSYIVLVDTAHTSIRLTYQAVGMYEDEFLLQEIQNKTDLDRTSLASWMSLRGQARYWETISREPSFGKAGLLETMIQELTRIRAAIANPYTSTDNYGTKITDLEAAISQLSSDLSNFVSTIYTETTVSANTVTDVYVHMFGDTGLLKVEFASTDGNTLASQIVDLMQLNNTAAHTVINETKIGPATIAFSSNVSGGRPILRANVNAAGTFKIKPLNVG